MAQPYLALYHGERLDVAPPIDHSVTAKEYQASIHSTSFWGKFCQNVPYRTSDRIFKTTNRQFYLIIFIILNPS